jgi:hypothetical protein
MRLVVDDSGRIDWQGYALLTSVVPLRDFLDLEEMAQVAGDRKFAWDCYLQDHPEYLSKLRPRTRARAREEDEAPRGRGRARAARPRGKAAG